jgi:multiple sugar transport system substrate-binding protein
MKKLGGRLALAMALGVALVLAACGGDDSSDDGFSENGNADLEGETIKVLMPYKVDQKLLDEFTDETGVEVEYNTAGWDAVMSKLIVANQASTYIADVTEFDWSFTGQFGGNGWVEPLQDVIEPELLDGLGATSDSFTSEGNIYAACYSNDFRMSLYNRGMFERAGLSAFPATFDELESDLDQLKSQGGGVSPMTLPMAATEGSVTPWYLLTLAMGGELFDENFEPAFADPSSAGYKALEFEKEALDKGWVTPGSVTMDDGPAFERFTGGGAAIALASNPGNLVVANDPKESSIAGEAEPGLIPGIDGPGATFGLQEGLSIPVTAEHKDAAAAFVNWWMEPDTQVEMYKRSGFLPCSKPALESLSQSGDLLGGQVVLEQFDQVEPLFPQGAPTWYSEFSSDAQGLINAALRGEMSVGDALDQLADQASELAQSSS